MREISTGSGQMDSKLSQNVREYAVLGVDIVLRRWLIFIVPIALAVPLAAMALHFAPTKYVAKSLILLQSANRAANTGGYARQNVIEQVAAIDAWLKSDHVLRDLLPQIMDIDKPDDPKTISALIKVARASISLSLIGGSALEVSFEGQKPHNLSKKLEIILARIMEGLTRPEQGIFNASQFVLMQRGDAARNAELLLDGAITRAGLQNTELLINQLRALHNAAAPTRTRFAVTDERPTSSGDQGVAQAALTNEATMPAGEIEQAISSDPLVVTELKYHFAAYQQALLEYQSLKDRLSSRESNYVGIFDAAENVLVVGRPQDPIFGESSARKLAMAFILLSIICAAGLVWFVEMLFTGLRTRSDFESLTDLPVIARLQRLPR